MRLVTYRKNGEISIGKVIDESTIVPLTKAAASMLALIQADDSVLDQARRYVVENAKTISLESVDLLAPIPVPSRNIMCLGKNYAEHAAETQRAWKEKTSLPEYPMIFNKATTCVNGPYSDIPYDPSVSANIDYEAELVVVISHEGKNIPREKAADFIFGYTVINDLTARDLQRRHSQFFKGKSLDGHAPMGPWIVTADEIADPQNLRVTCRVNGNVRQDDCTCNMIFDIPEIIAQLSLGMTLLPGDLIATGTPGGVGFARTPPQFLKPGDIVECEVQDIGTIRNRISV